MFKLICKSRLPGVTLSSSLHARKCINRTSALFTQAWLTTFYGTLRFKTLTEVQAEKVIALIVLIIIMQYKFFSPHHYHFVFSQLIDNSYQRPFVPLAIIQFLPNELTAWQFY